MAQQISTVQTSFQNQIASAQLLLQSNIDMVDGKVVGVNALFGAKVQAGGLIGGFGIYNDSQIVDAGFDVDRFWVGRTNSDRVKPFIIDNGITYVDIARIRDADIGTLKIGGNAVTIPVSAVGGQHIGNGQTNFTLINEVWIDMDQAGMIFAQNISSQNFGSGIRYWFMYIEVDGDQGMYIGGEAVTVSPTIAMSKFVGAGSHVVRVYWAGQDSGVRVTNSQLFVTGTKR